MMLEFDISCGDLNLHWDWSPFSLFEFDSKMVQEGCLKIILCWMHALLAPKLGLANSLPLPSFLKALKHFCQLQNCGPQFKVVGIFKMPPHFYLLKDWSNQF